MGMGSRVRCGMVRTEVSFRLNDAPGQDARWGSMNQQFAKQQRSHVF